MAGQTISFDDGAAYEQMMGVWSRSAGEVFLAWLAPPPGLRWIDVGCGSGAFTELIAERCAPAEIQGIDPSDAQLAFARSRPAARIAEFRPGDATDLPFPSDRFDAAVMALVLVFVPDPAKGVAELARVVRPGGIVAAYMWDMIGGGFPLDPILDEVRAMGVTPTRPPQLDASRLETMEELWAGAGLEAVQTREITVQRTFKDFDDFWVTALKSPSIRGAIGSMSSDDVRMLEARLREQVTADAAGHIVRTGRAHAVKGRVPN